MDKLTKIITLGYCLVFFFTIGMTTHAQVDQDIWGNSDNSQRLEEIVWGGQQDIIASNIGLGSFDPRIVVANLINIAMGFIGIMTVVMIMLAGFKIMLSGGNEDSLSEARKMIWGTFVGAFLMLASFGIAKFFIGSIVSAAGA